MIKKIIKITVLGCLSIFIMGCQKTPKININYNDNIIALGDSLTFGYGTTPENAYPEKLKKLLGVNVINAGINGDTTVGGLERLDELIIEHNPKLIIVGLGGNDMLRKNPESETIENLDKIIKRAKDKKIEVALLATPKPSATGLIGYLSDADFYEKIAEENDILLLDNIYSKWLSKSDYKSDLIHLNKMGYEKVAEDIYDKLQDKYSFN